jgi:hypothetical protein
VAVAIWENSLPLRLSSTLYQLTATKFQLKLEENTVLTHHEQID